MKNLKYFVLIAMMFTLTLLSSQAMASHKGDKTIDAKETQCAIGDTENKPALAPGQGSAQVMVAAYKGDNPCAAKNPCGANPCAVKQPCGAKQPCGVKQPCSPMAQPCAGKEVKGLKELIAKGEKLWNDPSLGKSGLSCNSCHQNGKSFKETVTQAYPHYVSMPNRVVTLDQMINFCMIVPMKAEPLAWDSEEMTALSAYIQNVVLKEMKGGVSQPCGVKQPCQPCGVKNPCSGK